jgi:hypothetical protein
VAVAYEIPLLVIRIIGSVLVIGTLYRMNAAGWVEEKVSRKFWKPLATASENRL